MHVAYSQREQHVPVGNKAMSTVWLSSLYASFIRPSAEGAMNGLEKGRGTPWKTYASGHTVNVYIIACLTPCWFVMT